MIRHLVLAVTVLSVVHLAVWTHGADTVTISGTVTGPAGTGVANVAVAAWVPHGEWVETTTDASGRYSLSLSGGLIHTRARAPEAMRLGERTVSLGEVSSSLTHDFELAAGYLVTGSLLLPGGRPPGTVPIGLEFEPSSFTYGQNEWLTVAADPETGVFRVVAAAGGYWIRAMPAPPYYSVQQPLDLTSADVTGLVLTVSPQPVNSNPSVPPDTRKIDIGAIDDLGEAEISGAAGAALPSARLLLVNLNSSHQASTTAGPDGSFSVRLFAPPGSAIMIKHGPPGWRWLDVDQGVAESYNPLPGTIMHVPFHPVEEPGGIPFAEVGGVAVDVDDKPDTTNTVGAGWTLTGSLHMDTEELTPGGSFHIAGTMRLYSEALSTSSDTESISVLGITTLEQIFDRTGQAQAAANIFMSTVLTASGLPIQGPTRATAEILADPIDLTSFEVADNHPVEASFEVSCELPPDVPPGTYRPVIHFDFQGLPTADNWVAAHVVSNTFSHTDAALPPITVRSSADTGNEHEPNRLIWRLLSEQYVLGTRGTGAVEDVGRFQLAPDIVTQGAAFAIPPVDPRSGRPIEYRIEPFLPMISHTDRRMPCRPLIPFRLPGGILEVLIEEPDGGVRHLEPREFVQSVNRTNSTVAGHDLNPGTTQLNDIYSLTTLDDAYQVIFNDYGLHHIIMTGEVEDVWGNVYSGGGVYEVWVAHPLDLDPGVLPGTPFAVGDEFNPAVRVTPRVPADVVIAVTYYPESDPERATEQIITGLANEHGVFSSSDAPITFSAPGEYRVELVARYAAPNGAIYMGSMVWGGIVMTPDDEAELVAHGRRGVDSQQTMPSSWFVSSQDLDIPSGAISHSFNPYFAGDVLWSRMTDGPWGGDSLLIVGTVQDTVGDIQAEIEERIEHYPWMKEGPLAQDRFDSGELPLFIAANDGRSPRVYTDQVEQIAYSYRSSQRPGVRVREVVSEDLETGGYWRLDTLYDDQPGVGLLGDQINDFKFQYVGAVYRDLVSDHSEYVGQGTGWIFIPDSDPVGSRAMPPYAGTGNGGWTTRGGPLLTLGDDVVDMFIYPTGIRPGGILLVGDTAHFAGHLMPPLGSQVAATITSPTGTEHQITGQANSVGYFYDSGSDLVVDEPGRWEVDVTVWHDGSCSGGSTISPYPSGDVLGSDGGRFWFYVPSPDQPPLAIIRPTPGYLRIGSKVNPIDVVARVPSGVENATLHYTISMPGFILETGTETPAAGKFTVRYDPVKLQETYPNIDLLARDDFRAGLADTVSIGLLLDGSRDGEPVYLATTVTLQGEEVSVGTRLPRLPKEPRRSRGRVE